MKIAYFLFLIAVLSACKNTSHPNDAERKNPFLVGMNVPVEYAQVTANDVSDYANHTVGQVVSMVSNIKNQPSTTFSNVFEAMDDIHNLINTTSNNCFMLFWVSPDSLIRKNGLAAYQLLDSLSTVIFSDKAIFAKVQSFKSSADYPELKENKKNLVDDMILDFELSGTNLDSVQLLAYKKLTKEINQLSASYSDNMNSSNEMLNLDEKGVQGLPEAFTSKYKTGEGKYEIPIINSSSETVLGNAVLEDTRKAYYMKLNNRAADKNLRVLDSLVRKRDELARLMGYPSYAAYNLVPKMAKNPQTVWAFVNDLIGRSREKAKADIKVLENEKRTESKNQNNVLLEPWDISFYRNQILKQKYQVNNEALRAYFPMQECLKGMFAIYQKLLGLEFRKVKNPSVWQEDVEMYEVYEADKLKGRFYLDLFPRPNKETWFYGVSIISGRSNEKGDEIPVAMLLGNFTRPTKTQPSLLSRNELNTLFHEFGHIVNMMSYHGEFSSQSDSKADFVEAMSQIFENWLWDYDILSSFAKNYKTGGTLPRATFDNMLKGKSLGTGFAAIRSQRSCLYDMNLYDKYNPQSPVSTDQLWKDIDQQLNLMPLYVTGTHPQASWIHINTNPVYMYGYLWSEVYAQDMFTEFKKNGLTDTNTGKRYRELILANGTQRDIEKAVEEFLGRASNNQAYIKSLGLE